MSNPIEAKAAYDKIINEIIEDFPELKDDLLMWDIAIEELSENYLEDFTDVAVTEYENYFKLVQNKN